MLNVTGNHDVGYGNDVTAHRVARFEAAFGPVNTNLTIAGHDVVVVNSQVRVSRPRQRTRSRFWLVSV